MAKRDDLENLPPIFCWYCFRQLPPKKVIEESIILARDPAHGGPGRLAICPSCLKENLCEETPRGRWFASPRIQVTLLDILFSKLPGAASEEVLQAISWYRENEDRRRYFFFRDGDARYMGRSFLLKLWPWWMEAGEAAGAGRRPKLRKEPPRSGRSSRAREPSRPARPALVTPYEILGLRPGAGPEQIRKAFHRLAVKYHPDKVHHLGEEFQAMAHVKFQELKRAYDALTEGPAGGSREGPEAHRP